MVFAIDLQASIGRPLKKKAMAKTLHALSDDRGTVIAGHFTAGVYYVRLVGYISSRLGIEIASHLRRQLADAPAVTCFFDVASIEGGDFAARSAIARALLANRAQVTSTTTLVAPGPIHMRARAFVTMLERAGQVVDSDAAFRARLMEAAPSSASLLDSNRPARVARSSFRPAARSLRPRARSVTHA
jgi:hypothetical protein